MGEGEWRSFFRDVSPFLFLYGDVLFESFHDVVDNTAMCQKRCGGKAIYFMMKYYTVDVVVFKIYNMLGSDITVMAMRLIGRGLQPQHLP